MNNLSEKTKHSMMVRVLTSIGIAVVGIPCLVLGGYFLFILALIVYSLAIYEILKANSEENRWYIWVVTYIFGLSYMVWPFIRDATIREEAFLTNNFFLTEKDFYISMMAILGYLLFLFVAAILDPKVSLNTVFYTFTMVFLITFGFYSILFVRYYPCSEDFYSIDAHGAVTVLNTNLQGTILFFYVTIGTFITDIGAYFTGVLFGKHKMNPRISPNKTWEGFVGGVLFSAIFSLSFALIMEYGFDLPVLPGVLQFQPDSNFAQPAWFVVLVSFIMPIFANIGDFLFSAIKRHKGIKDYSNLLPGHGGILDRLDSILVTMSIVSLIVIMINTKLGTVGDFAAFTGLIWWWKKRRL